MYLPQQRLDGWMSAAIVKKWWIDQHPEGKINGKLIKEESFNHEDADIYFLGWDYGDSIPDLSGYDKVIMCDVSFPAEIMLKLGDKFKSNFIWVDHHISALKELDNGNDGCKFEGLRFADEAACELTWAYLFPGDKMPEIVRLLGLYDSFRHKGTDEEQKVLEFQYGARQAISNYQEAYEYLSDQIADPKCMNVKIIKSDGVAIYKYLCTEAQQTYKKAFPITINERMDLQDDRNYYKFLAVNQERFNPVNFGIDYHKDGYDGFACFWYKDGKWMFSLYNDNGNTDCSKIAKYYGGGGHKGAAGFVADNETFNKIINSR